MPLEQHQKLDFKFHHSIDDREFNQDARFLIEFTGEEFANNSHSFGVKVQPSCEIQATLEVVYFEFARKAPRL